jgi:hypothetical protein
VTTFSILLVSYNFSFIEFPLYHSLGTNRTPKKLLDATSLAVAMTFVIYCSTGLLAIYLFGSGLQSNCLDNIAEEGIDNFLSVIVRIAFAVVVACHVPYIFFYGKEACAIVIDELLNGSTSAQLQKAKSEADFDEPPAYLNMRPALYYGVSLALYALVIFGSNLTDNLGIILDYLAALSISGMQFFVPGLCYIRLAQQANVDDKNLRMLSYGFCGFSILVSITILYNNIFG